MLWKQYRLRKQWYFQDISQKGEKIVRSNFFIRLLPVTNLCQKKKRKKIINNCLFGISISKNMLKKATQRNSCKREIKTMLIQHLKLFGKNSCGFGKEHPHYSFIISIRPNYLQTTYLFNKTSLYKLLFFIYHRKKSDLEDKNFHSVRKNNQPS